MEATPAAHRLEQIAKTSDAVNAAYVALKAAARAYEEAWDEFGAALYAEHGPDSPPTPALANACLRATRIIIHEA